LVALSGFDADFGIDDVLLANLEAPDNARLRPGFAASKAATCEGQGIAVVLKSAS